MEPDLRFFQAAATVIPTLFVAAAFTAPALRQREYGDDSRSQWFLALIVRAASGGALVVSVVIGETRCLTVLSYGKGTGADVGVVSAALAVEGFILLFAVLGLVLSEGVGAIRQIPDPRLRLVVRALFGLLLWAIVVLYVLVTTGVIRARP